MHEPQGTKAGGKHSHPTNAKLIKDEQKNALIKTSLHITAIPVLRPNHVH